jgi:peptidoglycan hydrolase-like protein with peptidoglycan-binding domain
MAEIEKKYSDYQTSECDTQETIEPIDDKLCPTCQINPNWKLPAAHWSMIQEAYLNESVCEYHVRVYEREKAVLKETASVFNNLEDRVKHVAVGRILVDLDKPLNDSTRDPLFRAAFIVDTFRDVNSQELGVTYLVGVPAFNMDQIKPNDSDESEDSGIEAGSGGEIIIDLNGFNRKLRQLRSALWTYGMYYASANKAGAGFVIRQENNEVLRINYASARSKLKNFKSKLNDRLKLKGYPKIGNTGIFKSKRFKKIKFVFRPNGKAYDLKQVFVLDADCDKYKKIPIPNGHLLRKPSMRVVYRFLENFDQVINDITAKETKPWLDFTLEHFYPKYIVDYGSLGEEDETKTGLECLLEFELGIGNGQVIDSLTAEIMSAFDTIEKQMAEEACRSLGAISAEGATSLAEKNQDLEKTPKEERELAVRARYQKEFENKFYSEMIKKLKDNIEAQQEFFPEQQPIHAIPTKDNLFSILAKDYVGGTLNDYLPRFIIPTYNFKNEKGEKVTSPAESLRISSTNQLDSAAKLWAGAKFSNLEAGSFGDQIQNSPHFQEAKDAADEVITNFENTYIDTIKNRNNDMEMSDVISTIGLCGMSKVAGKAMECLASGVSFDDFLDILIKKTFDFMEVNTLGLFLNNLPNSFRTELDEEIEKQFGSGVDISKLLGIKLAEGGGPLKDFVKSSEVAKRARLLFEKGEQPTYTWTPEELKFLQSQLGKDELVYKYIKNEMTIAYNIEGKVYYPTNGAILKLAIGDKKKEFTKYDKYMLRLIKEEIKKYKTAQPPFAQAKDRIASATGENVEVPVQLEEEIEQQTVTATFPEGTLLTTGAKGERVVQLQNALLANGITLPTYGADGDYQGETSTAVEEYQRQKSLEVDGKAGPETLRSLGLMAPLPEAEVDPVEEAAGVEQQGFDTSTLSVDESSTVEGMTDTNDQFFNDALQDANAEQSEKIDAGIPLSTEPEAPPTPSPDGTQSNSGFFGRVGDAIDDTFITASEIEETDDDELNEFEQAAMSFQETALGVKVDAVFDIIFDFVLDSIMDAFSLDELFKMLRSYPAVDFALDKIEQLFLKPCPIAPVIVPPPGDFMKSLSVDVCDPTFSLAAPKIIVPNISNRFKFEQEFGEIFREAMIKVVTDIAISLLTRLMSTLESALCNLVEAAGGIVAEGLEGNLKGSFYRALNEAFCNDGEDPNTSQSKAEELAEALFAPLSFDSGEDYNGAGAKVSNIVSSVATTEEFLEAMVAREGEENDQFNQRIANAVTALAPEMEVLMGSPDQVAFFFKSLGSFLPSEDRERIRSLLDAGVPNLPISSALCLTNDQLDEWNNMREQLLGGRAPVDKLNEETQKALDDVMEDVATLDSDGPFIGAITNEAMKDVCNPNNLINDVSQSETDKALEDEMVEGFFSNIMMLIKKGFMGKGGLLGEAMADVEGRREFGRKFRKLFRLNYANSETEREAKYTDSWAFPTQLIMNRQVDPDTEGDAEGVYPETVAIKQRKEILEGGTAYDFDRVKSGKGSSRNVVYSFTDSFEGLIRSFSYIQRVAASNLRIPKKTFGYNLQVIENINDEGPQIEVSMNTPVSISTAENKFLESKGFQYKKNEKQDIRKAAFQKIMQSKVPFDKNFSGLYEQLFETSNKKIVEALLTSGSDGLPIGYQFGYVSDDLTDASFVYTPNSDPDKLGTFANSDRIIALDPKIYGGRYSNPPYYVEPRKFTGWLELATTAFESQDGCDPKTPPLLSFKDIETRTKNLGSSLRNDPRLSKSRDCVSVKPFHLLLDSKSKAKLDGVVRTTVRTYIAEFFMTGYGLFSNLQIRPENFDASFPSYLARKMQSEMSELGTFRSNKKVRIVRERYWYAFLEQTVEAYQRMVDVDGVEPPPAVFDALNKIQRGLDKYRVADSKMKKKLRKEVGDMVLRRPKANYDPIEEINKGSRYNLAMAIAYRLADEDVRESFFDGQIDDKVTTKKVRYAKLKKLQFFQKIYFIKLFEKEALLIMSEFIRDELNRMSQLVIDGPTDKPYYFDLYKSFFGMESFFPQSTSRVGLNSYYLDKQRFEVAEAGEVPTVQSSNLESPLPPTEEPQYIVESYVRLVEREGADIPDFIRSRPTKYLGAVSLTDMSGFVDQNLNRLEDKNLSDYFGDLSFTYSGSFKSLMDKGFATTNHVSKLVELNKGTDVDNMLLIKSYRAHVSSRSFEDFDVVYDEAFLLEGETPTPTGTKGSTGVRYGLRVSVVLPEGTMSTEDIQKLKADPDFSKKSKEEKSFLFEDGTVIMPLASAEIDVVDAKFEDFDPRGSTEPYDLECLINKIVETPEFTVMFDKILNFRQASSMLSIYCMETLPAAIGQDESERNVVGGNPEVEAWDKTVNKRAKRFLRREFKSLYLSDTEDGLSGDDDDEDSGMINLIKLNNPFDGFAFPAVRLPWWLKRRMKTKVYDANGVECADPEKDLE